MKKIHSHQILAERNWGLSKGRYKFLEQRLEEKGFLEVLDPGAERLGMGDVAVTVLSITEGGTSRDQTCPSVLAAVASMF